MEAIAEILAQIIARHPADRRETMLQKLNQRSCENREEQSVRCFNDSEGDFTGYDCEICKNKGYIAYLRNERFTTKECTCMPLRRFNENMSKSGLRDLLKIYTFENYMTVQEWQKTIKYRAQKYVSDFSKEGSALKWLFVYGAVGSGKTHICTAACGEMLKKGGKVVYMLWREDSVGLKAAINDTTEYKRAFKPFKEAEILYIDDFFKVKKEQSPTEADINLAFELINHRYCMPNSKTIISSEKTIDEIIKFDEAIGSRISQRCGEYYRIKINPGEDRNWRLRE